jgi:NAD(P)-dependent dehydrogenase (short-subunit alcohol dehydrogenase family)
MSPTHSIIITGGNTGLGFETAKAVALDKAAMVVIACRKPQLGRDATPCLTAYR